jgi:IS1 family transposase
VSAKLEPELGVTYKTAWPIANKIRNVLMADDSGQVSGDVEVDEASIDGKPRQKMNRLDAARFRERSRATVFAAVKRGGRIKATVLPSRRGPALKRQVIEWVGPASIITTDDWPAYHGLDRDFVAHSRINHSETIHVQGSTHTNTVEEFLRISSRRSRAPTAGCRTVATGLPQRVHVAQELAP